MRFLKKYRRLRREGATLRRDPVAFLRYLLLDNELHTFSYPIRNEEELSVCLADALGVEPLRVRALFDEGRQLIVDKWRRPPHRFGEPTGQRLAWYAIARVCRPAVVIESGVDRGLGSVVLLTALEANRRDGFDGELISIDPEKGSGFLVPPELRDHWLLVRSRAADALPSLLRDLRVGLYVHDSLDFLGPEDLRAAVAHAAPHFVFITGWDTSAMREELARVGARTVSFVEQAIHPAFRGRHLLIGFVGSTDDGTG